MKKMVITVQENLNVVSELISLHLGDGRFNPNAPFCDMTQANGVWTLFAYSGNSETLFKIFYTARPNWAWYKRVLMELALYCTRMNEDFNLNISAERLFWSKLHEFDKYMALPMGRLIDMIRTYYDGEGYLRWYVLEFNRYVEPHTVATRIRLGDSLYWVRNDSEEMPG